MCYLITKIEDETGYELQVKVGSDSNYQIPNQDTQAIPGVLIPGLNDKLPIELICEGNPQNLHLWKEEFLGLVIKYSFDSNPNEVKNAYYGYPPFPFGSFKLNFTTGNDNDIIVVGTVDPMTEMEEETDAA